MDLRKAVILTPEMRRQLYRALCSAFRHRDVLERMVSFHISMNLTAIPEGSVEECVWRVIVWSESHGEIGKLIEGAEAENPTNPDLVAFLAALAANPPPPAPSGGPPAAPPDVENLNVTAIGLAHLDRYADALVQFEHALHLEPDNLSTISNRGLTYVEMGQYTEALADFNKVLIRQPTHAGMLNNRGDVFLKQGRFDEALTDFNRALMFQPDDPHTHNNRGLTYCKMHFYKAALADFNRTLELDPDHATAMYNMACYHNVLGNQEAALESLAAAIQRAPEYRHAAQEEPDLRELHTSAAFRELVDAPAHLNPPILADNHSSP